jgi:hypothetical protein
MKKLNTFINEALIKKDTKIAKDVKELLIKDIINNTFIYDYFSTLGADEIVNKLLKEGLQNYEIKFKKQIHSFTGPYKGTTEASTFLSSEMKAKFNDFPKLPDDKKQLVNNGVKLLKMWPQNTSDNICIFGNKNSIMFSSIYDKDYQFAIFYLIN